MNNFRIPETDKKIKLDTLGCLEKCEFSFKIKACEKFNLKAMLIFKRIKFSRITQKLGEKVILQGALY